MLTFQTKISNDTRLRYVTQHGEYHHTQVFAFPLFCATSRDPPHRHDHDATQHLATWLSRCVTRARPAFATRAAKNCSMFKGRAFAYVCGYYATRPGHGDPRPRRWPYRQGSVAFFGRIRRPGGSAREAAPPSTHTQYTTKVRAELNSRIYENRACTCRHTRWTSVRPSPRSSSPPRLPLRVVRVVCR